MTIKVQTAEVVELKQKLKQLDRQNEVLFNCWQASETKASEMIAKYLKVCRECDRLKAQIDELQQHLNPS